MSGRIKVFVIIGQLEIGGTERQLLEILPALNAGPIEIVLYAMRGAGALEPSFTSAGLRVVSPAHHSRRWIGLVRTAAHLLSVWRRERPAIVHFHLPEAYLLGGLCSYFAPRCVRLMSRRSLNAYQTKRPGVRGIERHLHRRMDAVIANSNAVRVQLLDEGVAPAKCAVIYNGVAVPGDVDDDDADELRGAIALPAGAIVVIVVANLIPYKGHADVLAAFAAVRNRLPAGSVLLLVGEDGGIGAELRRQAERSGIAAAVRFVGRVDDVERYYTIADIVVQASHEEGFSNAVLEAMAAGRPVIATRVGGNVEAVVDGDTGILVPARAPEAIADALATLAADPGLRERMGGAARIRVRDMFSLARCIESYRALYTRIGPGIGRAVADLIGSVER